MKISRDEAVRRYDAVRDELRAKRPDQWPIVVALCEAVPDHIDADAVWRYGRNKPCFSNIKVATGQRVARDLALHPDFHSFLPIAGPHWSIVMQNAGPSWKSNTNFSLSGRAADFVTSLSRGGLKSYQWRLYAIRELALALVSGKLDHLIAELVRSVAAHGNLPAERLAGWTTDFGRLAGRGWGLTTAYHLLTDLGVAPKPDIHLTRSVVRMGLLEPEFRSDLADTALRNDIRLQHLAARSASDLAKWIRPLACPSRPRTALREVDKVLMDWSLHGMARPL
jgi:hypothetical protein